jgi:hypothetical protein
MGVSVLATDGDANESGPGMIALGDGSVTYGITLPLEAAGLQATAMEILIAPDPSALMSDPGSFVGSWPPGFVVEVRDPTSGAWRMVGDLSERNLFTIDDPATALSAAGNIEVRVTGVAVDATVGPHSIFASATVSGVIDE